VNLEDQYEKPPSEIWRSLLSASGVLAVAILLGRLAGLVRELQLAAKFGLSHEADVAVLLLSIPDLFVSLLISGGLGAVLVPQLKSMPSTEATQLFHRASLWSLILFIGVAALFAIRPNFFFQSLAPGLPPNLSAPSIAIICVSISIPLTAITGISAAYLNAHDKFLVAGLGTLIFNLAVIAGLFASSTADALVSLGVAVLIGTVLRLLSQLFSLPRTAFQLSKAKAKSQLGFLHNFLLGTAATSLILVPPLLVRGAASFLAPGNVAAFNYAQKLIELPVGVLITTIGTVALTKLSGQSKNDTQDNVLPTLMFSIRLALIVAVCAMLFGYALMERIATFLFLRGEMDSGDVQIIAQLAEVALAAIPFVAVNSILSASLYARHQSNVVLNVNIAAVVACIVFTIPGLLTGDPRLLMAAVVGSQVSISFIIARRAGINLFGEGAIADKRFAKSLAYASAITLPFIWVSMIVARTSAVPAFVIAAVGFTSAVAVAIRLIIRPAGHRI
jgi:putative peptidoglycan lipid II flippase